MLRLLAVTVLTLLTFSVVNHAEAQTPVSAQTANQYYYNCKANQDPRMSAASQDAMCACNAAMMQRNFTMEDMQLMLEDSYESRQALNAMLLNVYAPCINFPLHDLLFDNCMSDRKVQRMRSTLPVEKFCGCVAENTSEWMANEGRNIMVDVIEQNPNIYDPIEPIMNHKDFLAEAMRNRTVCAGG